MECKDKNCPEHGELSTRGITLEGTVISDKMQGTVTVFRAYMIKVPKFERFKRKHSKIKAHNPPCVAAKMGDKVKIAECRPLSKDVHFVVISKESLEGQPKEAPKEKPKEAPKKAKEEKKEEKPVEKKEEKPKEEKRGTKKETKSKSEK